MSSRLFARLFLAVGLVALALTARPGGVETAQAQGVSVSVEFREALTPHGRWHRHSRWGEVWVPARVERDWRPYTRGKWVYTEEWGWYWVAEEEWGWIPYHYGRWVRDDEYGWVWIPGNEWAPAWVSWRRGGGEVGWAPLPPDDYDDYEDDPDYWVFVRSRDVIAPSIIRVVIPRQRVTVLVRETVFVNRTVVVSGRRIAANVGVPPSYIAARIGRPIRVSRVQPVVVRGTVNVRGAVEVDVRDRKGKRGDRRARRPVVKNAERTIAPAKNVPEPQRFKKGETKTDTPDAPAVLRQAQPDAQTKDKDKDKDAPKAKKQDDAAPKAKDKKGDDDAAPKTKQKSDDEPKARKKDDDDAAPKTKQKSDDEPKARKKDDDDEPKARKKDDDDAPRMQQKKGDDAAPKARKQDDDNDRPKAPPQQKRDEPRPAPKAEPKAEPRAAPKAEPKAEPKAPPRPEPKAAPKAEPKGPPPAQRKKDE